ncbi:cytochrome P450 [Lasiosphaeria miniovina]|uniref:Cytochrome P450 n=1 Tax=Lasiosphaeria miniovina TaxID=1954250 RepID=A0AA40AC32_9PEZI|nr:cytochrome P450 [Lasiosphaeria miniovina]KAK0713145.1 cytochrome P450 [Lasiosphaeria miniovina]
MISITAVLGQLGALAALGAVSLVVYRLYFHPLAKFPGPSLAAATGLYEAYYDCIKDGGGRFYVEIGRMHDKYGPIVRISPWELHIRDADWGEVYRVSRRASKPLGFYTFLGASGNAFSSGPHETHRMRREALTPFFTPGAVARREPEVEHLVAKLAGRLEQFSGTGTVLNLGDVFRCLATDGATAFAFRRPFGHLDDPEFEPSTNAVVRRFARFGAINRQTGGHFMAAMRSIPPAIALRLNPGELAAVAAEDAQRKLATPGPSDSRLADADEREAESNVIRQILHSSLPAVEKMPWRIERESSSVTLAGTETTGSILAFVAFWLLCDGRARAARLAAELDAAAVRTGGERLPTLAELKELPYLTGVVNEGLRFNSPSGRLPRYDPKNDMTYKGWVIPKGTIVSTTPNDTHFSAEIFKDPQEFLPERWLGDEAQRKQLSKYLIPFGRGTRTCVGNEVALMELYLTLGRLFSSLGPGGKLRLISTDYERDVKRFHDFFSPFPKSARGVRALVI